MNIWLIKTAKNLIEGQTDPRFWLNECRVAQRKNAHENKHLGHQNKLIDILL